MPNFTLIERLPEFLYPLGSEAYTNRLDECIRLYGIQGAQSKCTDLIWWHDFLHLSGALLFVFLVHVVGRLSNRAAVWLSVAFTSFFFYQECIDQPLRLYETPEKAFIDLAIWITPLVVYWIVIAYRTRIL